jgi:hypothetical protein
MVGEDFCRRWGQLVRVRNTLDHERMNTIDYAQLWIDFTETQAELPADLVRLR